LNLPKERLKTEFQINKTRLKGKLQTFSWILGDRGLIKAAFIESGLLFAFSIFGFTF
jgi:hypothetical protein